MWHWSVLYCTVLTNTVMIKAKFQNLQDLNSRTYQGFSSTFNGLEVFIPNSSIFKDFSSTLWTLTHRQTRSSQYCASLTAAEQWLEAYYRADHGPMYCDMIYPRQSLSSCSAAVAWQLTFLAVWKGAVIRLTQTRTRKLYPLTTLLLSSFDI